MKNHKFIYLGILVLGLLSPTIGFSDTLDDSFNTCRNSNGVNCNGVCTRNEVDEILLTDNNAPTDATDETTIRNACNERPDKYKIRFYKVGMCTSSPLATSGTTNPTGSEQGCYNFFDKSSETLDSGGTSIILTNNADGTVSADVSLAEGVTDIDNGSYGYFYAILSNMLEIQHIETFSSNVLGVDGTSGKVCWTIDQTTSYTGETIDIRGDTTVASAADFASDRSMKCGNSTDGDLAYSKEIINDMARDPLNNAFSPQTASGYQTFSDVNNTDLGGTFAAKLLKNDNLTIATSANDAYRIFYAINFSNPVVINDSTTRFEMSFNISGAVSVIFGSDGSNNLTALKTGADPFQIKVTAE